MSKEKKLIRNRNKAIVVYRLHCRGLTHNEIADHLNVKPKHVKSLILLGERLESLKEEA